MKKLIAILVVFALAATAVFAQDGSWSVWGSGEIGTIVNFVPKDADDDPEPIVGAHGYNFYDWYGGIGGSLGIQYNAGGISAGLTLNANNDWPGFHGSLSYDGGDLVFTVEQDISDLLSGSFNPGRLWGYYKFLDGAVFLELAVNSRDTDYWHVNAIVGNVFDSAKVSGMGLGFGWGFMDTDHHNYLLVDFNLSSLVDGLTFGVMIPSIFATDYPGIDGGKWDQGTAVWGTPGFVNKGNNVAWVPLKSALELTRFGVMYQGLLDVSLQFALTGANAADPDKLDSGLYFGLNYGINGQMSAGLGLEGYFDGDDSDKTAFAAAASFSYNDGPLSAKLEGGLSFANKDDKGTLGLRPYIAYNVVENYLCLSLDAFVFLYLDPDVSDATGIGYEITPTLWFNIMGTGAGAGYWWPNTTAIIIRYKVGGYSELDDALISALDITFKWSF